MPYARRLRVSGRLGHRMLALAVLTTLALLALALQAGSANAASLAVEGESLAASPTNDGTVLSDSTASGGRVRELWSNGSMNGSVTLASSADTLTVRARGSQCGGAPHMTAEVDGKQVLSVDVPPTTLTNYAAVVVS